jgi:DNA or RNA helicases of superfamily II
MELKNGLYEQVINEIISKSIKSSDKLIDKDKIDDEESSQILAQYLSKIIRRGLSYVDEDSDERVRHQINICNKIIGCLLQETGQSSLSEYMVSGDAEMLLAVLNKMNTGLNVSKDIKVLRPETPLSQSSLFTGSVNEPSMVSELKKEIVSSDRIDMLMSFIKWSGLRMITDELESFTKDKKLRIITTSYMGATDYKAVEFLSNLPNTEVKISYDTKRTRLHAKAYLFHRETGFSTAYIGSSNLSNAAISSGLEWNMKVTQQDSRDILKKFEATFEAYWHDREFTMFKPDEAEYLRQALSAERNSDHDRFAFNFDIQPYSYQKEILEKLKAEREIHKKYKNLVVAATGTGKTVVSAFDYKGFCQNNPKRTNRLLFIAHREEILKQSIDCFRMVLKNQNFGDLWVGEYQPSQIDHLFMSIQTFNSKEFEKHTTPEFYDYIIIDEFHHSAAPTYKKLLEYYKPRILLGLTATPERMDRQNILKYFDYRIAAEIRLGEAIDRKLLSPFQYFGVSDNVDLSRLRWGRGGYETSELDNVYTENTQRSRLIVQSLKRYVTEIKDVCGLGFCVSVNHAQYMANFFNKHGIPSMSLHSNSPQEERNSAKDKLIKREINFIFVVDLYNEGVDIPEVNTVLFLRPTESLTVFLQQLGRGLRLCEGKDYLTVLDFIGQAHKNYNFEEKYGALLGRTGHSVQREIANGFPNLPKGCFVQLEKFAQKYILENIKNSINNKISLIRKIATFTQDTGKDLTLSNFIAHYNVSLYDIYSKASWSRLCVEAGARKDFSCPDEQKLTKALQRVIHINSRRWIEFLLSLFEKIESHEKVKADENDLRMQTMFHYAIWQEPLNNLGMTSINGSLARLMKNRELYSELKEILTINYEKIDFTDQSVDLGFCCPMDLHCTYTRDEILSALGYYTLGKKPTLMEGVLYISGKNVDVFFITLNKSEKDYSPSTLYDDYAIDDTLFHWQSQSTTSDTSSTGQRYINQRRLGSKVLLFVRDYKKENGVTSPYYYLGKASYVSHTGSRPINIVWRLDRPMPAFLVKKAGKMIVG